MMPLKWTKRFHSTPNNKIRHNKESVQHYLLALITHVFPQSDSFHFGITFMAQSTILIAYETTIGQFIGTHFTSEAAGMPIGCHCFDDPTNNKFTTLVAARCEQNVKISFAILSSLEFVENAILEGTEALCTAAVHPIGIWRERKNI